MRIIIVMSIREAIEFFHLVFLRHLAERLDNALFTLKGGCNLRFFYKSIRYSEDIDLDIKTIAVSTLQKNVRKVLGTKSLIDLLESRGVSIENISEPKQTGTVQRWKLSLKLRDLSARLPTKIEFSRRDSSEKSVTEAIDSEIIRVYQLYPIIVPHYDRESAAIQKIRALIGRNETQARDVFDLSLLSPPPQTIDRIPQEELEEAKSRAISLSFSDFKSQVVAFLSPEYQQYYSQTERWEEILLKVTKLLGGSLK